MSGARELCGSRPTRAVLVSILVLGTLGSFVPIEPAVGQDRSATVLIAGDIASCRGRRAGDRVPTRGPDATAALLDRLSGTILAVGDLAYDNGTAADFADCYEPTWGRHRARTWPVPGNHEYNSKGAAPYFAYWRERLGEPDRKFYGFDLGAWHIVALNSNIDSRRGSAQERWLRADLAATSARCILAFWHHPRFSSGDHGSIGTSRALFEALYEFGASLVVSGHDHDYERFAPQDPRQRLDPLRGVRQFVVGTGGRPLRKGGSRAANSEVFEDSSHGVLKLDLGAEHYAWQFIPVAGQTFQDSGSAPCVRRDLQAQ